MTLPNSKIINVGTTANDKKGDSLRAAFQKVNANFDELYTALGLTDTVLNLGEFEFNSSTISTTNSTPIVIDQATTVTGDLAINGVLTNNNSVTKTTSSIVVGGTSVVWVASSDSVSGVKLFIQVEADQVGDATGWHSQVCEAVIASRGYASSFAGSGGIPLMSVYGITYTSTVPLVTFNVQRNATTKFIEVVATSTVAADTPPNIRIYSVETATNN